MKAIKNIEVITEKTEEEKLYGYLRATRGAPGVVENYMTLENGEDIKTYKYWDGNSWDNNIYVNINGNLVKISDTDLKLKVFDIDDLSEV